MKKIISIVVLMCLFANGAFAGKKKLETSYRYALVLAYSPDNIYEDENIKLQIYNEKLWITNKTDRTIFIDYSQCFLTQNGSSFPMYSKKQDEKKASKVGVSSSVSEYLSIAPSTGGKQNETFVCNMGEYMYGSYSTTETPTSKNAFSEFDKRFFNAINYLLSESIKADPKGERYIGTSTCHFTEDESVSTISASIAYAFNKNSDNWKAVTLSTWISDIIFAPCYFEKPKKLSKKEKRGFGIKESEDAIIHIKAESPFEYEQDKSPLFIADWTGNYKKGTFHLSTALVFGYRITLRFDGKDANWGEMKYNNFGVYYTKQEIK